MKIEIKADDNLLLTISDDQLDNDNFVELYFGGDEEMIISLDELLSALTAFDIQRKKRAAREATYNK